MPIAQIAALIVQPCKGSTGNWTGEGRERGGGGGFLHISICSGEDKSVPG